MVEPFPGKARLLALRFPFAEYHVDEATIREAVVRPASFDILHPLTGFKIDVFVRKDRPFDREGLARRVLIPVFGENDREYGVITAEDTILIKLEWYRLGGETSDRQWNDIIGVMKIQYDRLDAAYLDRWAAELGVSDLLVRARSEG